MAYSEAREEHEGVREAYHSIDDAADHREKTTTLEDVYESDWSDVDAAYYGVVKRGVRKRLKGTTTALCQDDEAKKNDGQNENKKEPERPPARRRSRSGVLKILEIFTWTMAVSSAAYDDGWKVLEPIDSVSGWNIDYAHDRRRALEYVDKEKPDLVVCAWDCTPWTSLQT